MPDDDAQPVPDDGQAVPDEDQAMPEDNPAPEEVVCYGGFTLPPLGVSNAQ